MIELNAEKPPLHPLDHVLKTHIGAKLAMHKESISWEYPLAQESFLEVFLPMWDRQIAVNEEIELHYFGMVGNRSVLNASQLVTNMMSMVSPVFLRPERFLREMPDDLQDQIPNQHVNYNLSMATGIPLSLLLPVEFDEEGNVTNIFDMIISGPNGEPIPTQWAIPAISALSNDSHNLPHELEILLTPPGANS